MILRRSVVVVASLSLLVAATALAGPKERSPGARKEAPAAALQPGWKVLDATAGGFALAFPGDPVMQEQKVPTEAGEITATMYILEADNGNVAYMAGFNDYPTGALDPDANKVLDGARDGAVQNVEGTLKSEKRIATNGHPGRELVIRAPIKVGDKVEGYMLTHARIHLVNNRLVQALVVMPEDDVKMTNVRAYLDSLKISTPKAGK